MAKKIIITGGTGLIGSLLSEELLRQGYTVYVLTRNKSIISSRKSAPIIPVLWDARSAQGWADVADGAFAIINLAGENVASGRWTAARKEMIMESRLNAAKAVHDAIKQCAVKPSAVIQASAAGFYGMSLEDTVLDESGPAGTGFLARVTRQWEESSLPIQDSGVRMVIIRTGLVLDRSGGALKKLLLPYTFFAGGPVGTGRQYMSWIHMKDEINAILYLMENQRLSGVFNLTAPHPVTSREFSNTLGKVLHRPSWFTVPSCAVKSLFGEMGEEALLKGQRVVPKRLVDAGFQFLFPELQPALEDLLH